MFGDDAVDQEFGGVGKHQSGHPVDDHQHEAQRQQTSARTHQFPDRGQDGRVAAAAVMGVLGFGCRGELTAYLDFGWRAEGFIFAGFAAAFGMKKARL